MKFNTKKYNSKKQNIFFTSDLHYGHDKENVWGVRGYTDVAHAMEKTVETWNSIVKPGDIVFNLGDLAFNDGDSKKSQYLIDNLNGDQYFLWGNHNSGVKAIYKNLVANAFPGRGDIDVFPMTIAKNGKSFTFMGDYLEIYVDGVPVVMCHFPIKSWNSMSHPAYHLYGHCHMSLAETAGFAMDVGWDRAGKPLSWQEIVTEFSTREFVPVDHHADKSTCCM